MMLLPSKAAKALGQATLISSLVSLSLARQDNMSMAFRLRRGLNHIVTVLLIKKF